MKKFVIICCAFFIINLVRCDIDQSHELELLRSCQKQEDATDQDVEDYKNGIEPASKIVKCLAACFNEKMGWVADNKLIIPAMEEYIESVYDDQKEIADLKAIVKECEAVTDEDRCEMVVKVEECFKEGLKKRGFE